ncbi:hypothetical protein BCR35DRAFT_311415 [Leucosporidium creatinivorum]|uniref:F-box domain-containing protein n=1 Tax=Leucosporidium creatinivorum TaxID=106004 RepID=A0A1Y2C0I7_9BASI|nr:hypothetical protein BCR35DRAFT_311415 [Leucosporidium creatinivorum]
MPVPSLPVELIGLILAQVDEKSLARCARVHPTWLSFCQQQLYHSLTISRRRELDDQYGEPPLLATLQSCPALAAHVRKLDFDGWYSVWNSYGDEEAFEESGESQDSEGLDDLYLAQLLKCCTGLRRLELSGAFLWIDDLIFTPRLVSLTFTDWARLRSRHKQPEMLALPPIQHLHTGIWRQPSHNRRIAGISIDDLGPSSISLFSSLTHLDANIINFRIPEELSNALQHITPNLQSLSFRQHDVRRWEPLLPLCTSLKQLSWHSNPTALNDLFILRHLPPSLAFLHLAATLHGRREEGKKLIAVVTSSVEGLEGLKSLQLDFNHPLAWESDLEILVQACKKKGVVLRAGRMGGLELGKQLVGPRLGTEEVRWTQIWSQVPL